MKNELQIILIDNDETVLYLHRLFLEEKFNATQIVSFTDCEEALAYLKSNEFEQSQRFIILLDINMPMMDGWEWIDEINKTDVGKNLHIFMVSSSINPTDFENIKKYPQVIGYLEKPIDEVFINKLNEYPALQYLF